MALLLSLALTVVGIWVVKAWVVKADKPLRTEVSQADFKSVGLIYLDTPISPRNVIPVKAGITDYALDGRRSYIPVGHYIIR